MKLIVGLGNPGEEYSGTRHNVGFVVVEQIYKSQMPNLKQYSNSNFQINKTLHAEIVKIIIGEEDVILAKPLTFMNNSGEAVKKIARSYELSVGNDLIVVHDDIGLALGEIKISKNVGSGKHNGAQSIIDHLGTKNFVRVRCGIGRGTGILSDIVLSKFKNDELVTVENMIMKASELCAKIITEGSEKAMQQYN